MVVPRTSVCCECHSCLMFVVSLHIFVSIPRRLGVNPANNRVDDDSAGALSHFGSKLIHGYGPTVLCRALYLHCLCPVCVLLNLHASCIGLSCNTRVHLPV